MLESLYGAVVLSKGSMWAPEPYMRPWLRPQTNGLKAWPDNSVAYIEFTGTDGVPIIDRIEGDVTPDAIRFRIDSSICDQIPAGANFEIFLDTNDGVWAIRYGKVIRKEPTYTTPLAQQGIPPLIIADNFQRTALGRNWLPVSGTAQMVDNTSDNLPIGVATNGSKSAYRYKREFSTSGVEIGVTLLNRTPGTAAKTGIILDGDVNYGMGLVVVFETGSSANRRLHLGTMTSPTTFIDRAPTLPLTMANNDYFLIRYIPSTRALSVYQGNSLDPITDPWVDTTAVVPHGPGFRTAGWFQTRASSSTKGLQIVSLTAKDAA